jgi:hypothetical protein
VVLLDDLERRGVRDLGVLRHLEAAQKKKESTF